MLFVVGRCVLVGGGLLFVDVGVLVCVGLCCSLGVRSSVFFDCLFVVCCSLLRVVCCLKFDVCCVLFAFLWFVLCFF